MDHEDPNELGTFTEYLDHYAARGGMTDDERTGFWAAWSKHTMVWTGVLVGALLVAESFSGIVNDVGLIVGIYAGLVLIWQVVDAVRFWREVRRRQS